ncbi:MAG: YceI family protein [Bacteroidota bacterium]
MNRIVLLVLLLTGQALSLNAQKRFIARQGQVTFFSYTSVENIEATNNQVFSILDFNKNELAVSILMRAFVFPKALMQEHFNESYMESDIYPKSTFEGDIIDFDASLPTVQTKIIKGRLTVHGITKEKEIKTKIEFIANTLVFSGSFDMTVADYKIKIPPIVAGNIAKTIAVKFRFEFQPYEQ